MIQAHLALPRPAPPLPATDAQMPDEINTTDLALALAALAIETPHDDTAALIARCGAALGALIDSEGQAPSLSTPAGQSGRKDAPSARFEAGMWAGLALLLALPGQYPAAEAAVIRAALRVAARPYRAVGDVVRFGQFILGDGTHLGDSNGDSADLLRESALAGLALHAAGLVRADAGLYAASQGALRAALSRFRAPDGSLYAHAVTPGGMAGFGRDSEGEALLGLLCLRLRADEYADELLASVERYAAARLSERGQTRGYSQDGKAPWISIRATLLVGVFQREAGRFGLARNTLRGLEPLRDNMGLLGGLSALTVASEAALDARYLQARRA